MEPLCSATLWRVEEDRAGESTLAESSGAEIPAHEPTKGAKVTTSGCDHLLKRPLATYSFDPTGLFWDLPRRLRTCPVLPWCSPDLFATLLPTSPEIFLPSLLILEPFSPYLSGYLLAFNLSLPFLRFFLPSPSFWNPFPCLSGDHESNVYRQSANWTCHGQLQFQAKKCVGRSSRSQRFDVTSGLVGLVPPRKESASSPAVDTRTSMTTLHKKTCFMPGTTRTVTVIGIDSRPAGEAETVILSQKTLDGKETACNLLVEGGIRLHETYTTTPFS